MCAALWLTNPRFVWPAEAQKTIMLCMSKLTRKRSAEPIHLKGAQKRNTAAERSSEGGNGAAETTSERATERPSDRENEPVDDRASERPKTERMKERASEETGHQPWVLSLSDDPATPRRTRTTVSSCTSPLGDERKVW